MNEITALSASERKLIVSLQQAKHRRQEGLFVAEGGKCVGELAGAFRCRLLTASQAWLEEHCADMKSDGQGSVVINGGRVEVAALRKASKADLERATALQSAPEVIALMEMKQADFAPEMAAEGLVVALDAVQDPGNLGTIIRTCDWFGVRHIICSADTVDAYNPKVVQSTMGGLARVAISKVDLPATLAEIARMAPVYGTFLDGDNLNTFAPERQCGVIVMGNEGRGITSDVAATVNRRLYIPSYPAERTHVESLNVAIATAIILAAFRRG